MNAFSKTLLAAAVVSIFTTGVAVAQSVPADNSTPLGNSVSNSSQSSARNLAYNNAMTTARSDYKTAMANCKEMTGPERRSCNKTAGADQKTAMGNARALRSDRTSVDRNEAGKSVKP